jgi:hypothetical protein
MRDGTFGVAWFAAAVAIGLATTPASAQSSDAPQDAHALEEAARAARMAEDRARYAVREDRPGRSERDEAIAKELRKRLADAHERFVPVKEGVLTDVACQNWLAWNVPAEGETIAFAAQTTDSRNPFGAFVDTSRQLRAHGIDFLLVIVPTRLDLYPELYLDPSEAGGGSGRGLATDRFVRELVDAGVEVLDLEPEFQAQRYGKDGDTSDQLFLKFNTHWSARGAELAATLVHARLARFPWYVPGPKREGVDFVVNDEWYQPKIVWGGTPPGSAEERCLVHAVTKPDLRSVSAELPSSRISVFGGSFVDFHRVGQCDFVSQLFRLTGQTIDLVSVKGGLEDAERRAFAESSASYKAKKRIVIWVIPDAALRPSSSWRPFDLFPEAHAAEQTQNSIQNQK